MLIKTRLAKDKVTFPYQGRSEPCPRCGFTETHQKVYYTVTKEPVEVPDEVGQHGLEQFPRRLERVGFEGVKSDEEPAAPEETTSASNTEVAVETSSSNEEAPNEGS